MKFKYANFNLMFQVFYENDKLISLEELEDFFSGDDAQQILNVVNELETNNLIEGEALGWHITDYGRNIYKNALSKQQQQKEQSSKEYEKLHLEVENLRNEFFDNAESKQRAKQILLFQ